MMTQTDRIYNAIKEDMLNENPDYVEVTSGRVLDKIWEMYPDSTVSEAAALLESINIRDLESDIVDTQREEQSYHNNPLEHVGMSWRDFV